MARVGVEADRFTNSCSFSMKTNVNTVCGLSVGQPSASQKIPGHSRQPEPGRRPTLHKEPGSFFTQAFADDLHHLLGRQRANLVVMMNQNRGLAR